MSFSVIKVYKELGNRIVLTCSILLWISHKIVITEHCNLHEFYEKNSSYFNKMMNDVFKACEILNM